MDDSVKMQIETCERVASIETKIDFLIESVDRISILHEECPARAASIAKRHLDQDNIMKANEINPRALRTAIVCGIGGFCVSLVVAIFGS